MSAFQYAVNTNSLKGWKPADVAALVKRCGYDGIEWGFSADGDLNGAGQRDGRSHARSWARGGRVH